MKKITITLVMLITIIMAFVLNAKTKTEYSQTFVVTEVTEDEVICVDFNGNEWSFNDTEDWLVGDFISAIMNDNGTKNIYDDYFVSVRYAGWLDGSWGYDYETSNSIISIK